MKCPEWSRFLPTPPSLQEWRQQVAAMEDGAAGLSQLAGQAARAGGADRPDFRGPCGGRRRPWARLSRAVSASRRAAVKLIISYFCHGAADLRRGRAARVGPGRDRLGALAVEAPVPASSMPASSGMPTHCRPARPIATTPRLLSWLSPIGETGTAHGRSGARPKGLLVNPRLPGRARHDRWLHAHSENTRAPPNIGLRGLTEPLGRAYLQERPRKVRPAHLPLPGGPGRPMSTSSSPIIEPRHWPIAPDAASSRP